MVVPDGAGAQPRSALPPGPGRVPPARDRRAAAPTPATGLAGRCPRRPRRQRRLHRRRHGARIGLAAGHCSRPPWRVAQDEPTPCTILSVTTEIMGNTDGRSTAAWPPWASTSRSEPAGAAGRRARSCGRSAIASSRRSAQATRGPVASRNWRCAARLAEERARAGGAGVGIVGRLGRCHPAAGWSRRAGSSTPRATAQTGQRIDADRQQLRPAPQRAACSTSPAVLGVGWGAGRRAGLGRAGARLSASGDG